MSNQLRGFLQMLVGLALLLVAIAGIVFGQILAAPFAGILVSFSEHPLLFVGFELVWLACATWAFRAGRKTYRTLPSDHLGA